MEIRNEAGEVLEAPDMAKGYTVERTETLHHEAIEAVEEQSHYETLKEYENGGKDVKLVIDVAGVEAQPAYDEAVTYLLYVPYTDEELAERAAAAEAAEAAAKASDSAALELAAKLATATTLSQVRSFSAQVAEKYASWQDQANGGAAE